MKVARLGRGTVDLVEVEKPTISHGELLVEMHACGLCGSDVEKVKGNYQATGRIGHEPAGVVSAVGDGVTEFSVGDRVFVHHHVPCYTCEVCRSGAYNFCPSYQKTNIDPGGFAEFFRVPRENVARGAVLHLPDHVSFEEGAMIEPLGCCIDASISIPFTAGERALVVGLGPIGLLYLRLLRAKGAGHLVGTDISSFRREVAKRSGADVVLDPLSADAKEDGFDVVVVATGSIRALSDGIRRSRRGGTVNLFGLPEKGSHLETDLQELYMRGIRLIPTYATTEKATHHALRLISSGKVMVKDLVTHRFPLERIGDAFKQTAEVENTVKIMVTSGH